MQSVNPATGEVIREYTPHSYARVEQAITGADQAFQHWKHTSFEARAKVLRHAAEILRDRQDSYARLITGEMGKAIGEAGAEVKKCAFACEYYADNAERFLADETVETDFSKSLVTYRPQGIILAIMPWNFPFWQVFRFAAPTLMAGNVGLLKHASNVPGCALAIEEIFREAGLREHVFQTLLIGSEQVSPVIDDTRVRGVTLTGSAAAGKAVAAQAGKALKKTVLELGGSDPYLILADADIGPAAEACAKSRLLNAGQSCIAAKRFIVVEEVYEDFLEAFVEQMKQAKMGDPLEEDTDIGPQATTELRDQLHRQVTRSIELGATCLLGGDTPEGAGAFYPPTVLTEVKPDQPAYEEELFGPVAAVIKVKDEDEAIAVANDSPYGLGGGIFTRDTDRGLRLAREEIDTGNCFINTFVQSDPRLPFGGVKESGYGRELAAFGIREFVNIKTVALK